jgi:hypothetical protein
MLRIGEAKREAKKAKRIAKPEEKLSFGNKQSQRVKLDELPFAAAATVTPPIYHGQIVFWPKPEKRGL